MAQLVDQLNGYGIYAQRAVNDEDGNQIKTTYAKTSDLPNGVPTVTSGDDGKVLKATYSGGTGTYSWETAPSSGVPSSTSADEGKVLTVDSNGDPNWATPAVTTVHLITVT